MATYIFKHGEIRTDDVQAAIGVGKPDGTLQPLLGVFNYTETGTYLSSDRPIVNYHGDLFRLKSTVGTKAPGAWNPGQWESIGGASGGLKIDGTVATVGDLPAHPQGGDGAMYLVDATGDLYVFHQHETPQWKDVGHIQGPPGPAGAAGAAGQDGAQGPQGDPGTPGIQGVAGPQGPDGPQGPIGPKGNPGSDGQRGPRGIQGPQGVPGTDGHDGAQGPAGATGHQGPKGERGTSIHFERAYANLAALKAANPNPEIGETHLVTADGNLYVFDNPTPPHDPAGAAWHNTGHVQGPEGPQGPPGHTGPKGDTGDSVWNIDSATNIHFGNSVNYHVGIGRAPAAAHSLITAGSIYSTGNLVANGMLDARKTSYLHGNVGIGKAPTSKALDIEGEIETSGDALFGGTVDAGGAFAAFDTARFYQSVGIGTAPDSAYSLKVHGDTLIDGILKVVSGAANGGNIETTLGVNAAHLALVGAQKWSINSASTNELTIKSEGPTPKVFHFTPDGNFTVPGQVSSGGHVLTSDMRLKKVLAPITGALGRIESLQGFRYTLKTDPDRMRVGLSAQDVQKIQPESVFEDPDKYLGVDYGTLVPLLVEGIKELQNENRAIRAALREQEKIIRGILRKIQE